MVHIIKVYFTGPKQTVQIRRLAVNSDVVSKFDLLARKIQEMFPGLARGHIEVTWKDSENDIIHMSSDEELAQALASAEDDILRIYAYSSDIQQFNDNENQNFKSSHKEVHQNVICDGCEKTIEGYRYKCLQCRNFDLCSSCNAANKHEHHDMIKLVRPTHIPREWVFPGARKIWRSMFGRCPHSYFTASNENKEEAKCESKPNQWHGILDDLLKGGYVSADKLIKENLGGFLNFIESVSGNLDVKLERDDPCMKKEANKAEQANINSSPNVEPSCTAAPCHSAESVPKDSQASMMPKKEEQLSNSASSNAAEKEKKENLAKPCGLFGNLDTKAFEASGQTKEGEKIDKVVKDLINLVAPPLKENNAPADGNSLQQDQVKNPLKSYGLFGDNEKESDGWTILNKQEVERNEAKPVNENGAKPKYASIYPAVFVGAGSCDASPMNADVKSKEANCNQTEEAQVLYKPAVKGESEDKFAKLKQDENVSVNYDPEIMNALIKMQAMGFTNEGGWLERLLITKDGNINATLDALYPNTRRH